MKRLLPLLALCILGACNSKEGPKVAASKKSAKAKGIFIPKEVVGIEGYYSGDFISEAENNDYRKITLRIDSVLRDTVYGWSIVAGNEQVFRGPLKNTPDGVVAVEGREPGTDAHDGRFELYIDGDKLTGLWKAYDPKVRFPVRRIDLKKRAIRYDAALMPDSSGSVQEGFMMATMKGDKGEVLTMAPFRLNASTRELRSSDLENLYKSDLEMLRNTIYARHGYSFRNARMRDVFEYSVNWYVPVAADVTGLLTPLEQKNIALIKRYEGHAEKYYDSFGR